MNVFAAVWDLPIVFTIMAAFAIVCGVMSFRSQT